MNAVVIPCYKVKEHILNVLSRLGSEIDLIYVVDDCCPDCSGIYVKENCSDTRVNVLFHKKNLGVGGAVITGYKQALADGAKIIIKIDGDGQMDPENISQLILPIQNGEADYCKGNRFYDLEKLISMPKGRLFGNSMLSLMNKMVNGYWNIIDPTNGFTAIHYKTLELLPLNKIDKRYFFESDMLFRLSIIKAVVMDIPFPPIYKNEKSNLNITKVLFEFPLKCGNRFVKRIFYNYLLRDFNAGSVQLFFGLVLFLSGFIFGLYHWFISFKTNVAASSGTVMISAILLILGFQLLLGALNYDLQNIPKKPIQKYYK